jgi:hypothetical protein
LNLKIIPKKIGLFKETLIINIAGAEKAIRITFKYRADYAKGTVQICKVDVSDEVIIGCSSLHKIVIRNDGDTINRYIFDLRLWNTLKIMPGNQDKNDPAIITEISCNDDIYYFDSVFEETKYSGKIFITELLPRRESQIILQYSPKSPENIVLNIPLILVGGQKEDIISLNLKSLPSPITILTEKIDFRNKVVFERSKIMHIMASNREDICFKNNTAQALSWKIEFESEYFQKGIFKLDQIEGVVQPNQTETIKAAFNPEIATTYKSEIFLVVNYSETHAEFPITLVGNGVKPSLVFNPPEIFLPIVASGNDSVATFSIINYGCERTELTVVSDLELKKHNMYLELEYLESKILKGDGEQMQAAFRFGSIDPTKPCLPISFSTRIEFINSAKDSFFMTVHGTSDNSVFSLQSYFWTNRNQYYLKMDDEKSIKFTNSGAMGDIV